MWEKVENKLVRHFVFNDFKEALNFMNQIGALAEKQHHHPEIYNAYNKVTLWLTTHDENNTVTEKDHQLSISINQLIQ
jgi:4a-hydroxytetrahydrobiopterin dehydratase